MTSAARSFGIALGCVAGLALGLRLWIAAHAWFTSDDFHYLYWVQTRHWSWTEAFVPTRSRGLALAYRPLGLDSYFYANFAAFGWNAFGYYLSALAVQTATAAVVYRIARQESYERRIAWVAAAIAWVAGPSLIATDAVSEHNYLVAGLFYALTLSTFLEYLRTHRRAFQVGSCAALLFGLGSNDLTLTAAPLVFGLAFARSSVPGRSRRALAALRRTWPQLLMALLFVDFRIWGVPWPQRGWLADAALGPGVITNSLRNLVYASGGGLRLTLLFLLTAAALVVLHRERARRSALGPAWLAVGLVPFALAALPGSRYALALLPALALSIGAVASVLVGKLRSQRLQTAALVGLVALCVPWEDAIERAIHPGASQQRQAYALARSTLPLDFRSCVSVSCGRPGLANSADCAQFRELTFGGDLFRAVVPKRDLEVEIDDANLALSTLDGRDCLTYELRADRRLVVGQPAAPVADEELSQLH